MIEKISIDGHDVWITIEAQETNPDVIPTEYFVAYYSLHEPAIEASVHEPGKEPGKVFNDTDGHPKRFTSPVEAVEYAVEKLPVILG